VSHYPTLPRPPPKGGLKRAQGEGWLTPDKGEGGGY